MSGTIDAKRAPASRGGLTHSPHLVVLLECDRPLAGSARFALSGVDRVVLGRGDVRTATPQRANGLVTLDVRLPGPAISVQHAQIVRVRGGWVVEDTGSRNGTFVGGARVERALLGPVDAVEVGETLLFIDPASASRDDTTSEQDGKSVSLRGVGARPATLDGELDAQLDRLTRVAASDLPVLVLGESGTGKEVLARWVHTLTARHGDFVAVNCGAIPATLLASQLFGHARGAFSGAVRAERGSFRAAEGGTLLLDEISDLPRESQAALLRALQEREVVPLGATHPIPVDVRVVTATSQPLSAMVARGEFRRDLYARLAGFVVNLPPLRERRGDLGLLVAALLPKVAPGAAAALTFTTEVARALFAYDWPFNIRELEQCLAMSAALAGGGRIELSHLPPAVARALHAPAEASSRPGALPDREDRLRVELLAALEQHSGNLAEVAATMGKARMQIHRWCKRFGIDPNIYRKP